jgi:GT2 family glycosyltransferase
LRLVSRTVEWKAPDVIGDAHVDHTRVTLEGLHLPPSWYRLNVWTLEHGAIISARARIIEDRRPELRIRMEPAGSRRLEKIFKIAEPLSSLTVSLEGAPGYNVLTKVEIRPLGRIAILAFLAIKGIRYLISNRGHVNWKTTWGHFQAALHPRGNFAFRGRYERPGNETYDKWQAVHEHPNSGATAANELVKSIGRHKTRVGLVISDDFDAQQIKEKTEASLIGDAIELVMVDRASLAGADIDYLLPIDHEGIFPRGAIERLILELSTKPHLAAVFADDDSLAPDGTRQAPRLKPPWDRELLWCTDYIKAPLVVRWSADLCPALELPGAELRPAYALALTVLERRARDQLDRVPAILFHQTAIRPSETEICRVILSAHLKAFGYDTGLSIIDSRTMKVDWPLPAVLSLVSIIIPSKDNAAILKACIDSVISLTKGIPYEIVVADNGSTQPRSVKYLNELQKRENISVVSLPGPFNFSKINNDARKYAKGDILIFLNDDTQVIVGEWLIELVSLACRPQVGAVGALLLYPDGSVQHAGVLLGVGGPADHAFRYMAGESCGYLDMLKSRREVTAVTGACLAVSADKFDAVGGFDEELMVTCNDVDLCLRLRARGWANIWTPWARLEHWESMSRGIDFTEDALQRQADELSLMTERWGNLLDRDPTYHPGLSDFAPDYCLSV